MLGECCVAAIAVGGKGGNGENASFCFLGNKDARKACLFRHTVSAPYLGDLHPRDMDWEATPCQSGLCIESCA